MFFHSVYLFIIFFLIKSINTQQNLYNNSISSENNTDYNDFCDKNNLLTDYVKFPITLKAYVKSQMIYNKMKDNIAYVSLVNLPFAANRTAAMLQRAGINVKFIHEFSEEFYNIYRPGIDCVIEMALTTLNYRKPILGLRNRSTLNENINGLSYNDHYRILIQSEILTGRFATLPELWRSYEKCHISKTCIFLEYSDLNYQVMKNRSFENSVILAPSMYINLTHPNHIFPLNTEKMKSFHSRHYDFSSFVSNSHRRKIFGKLLQNFTEIYNLTAIMTTSYTHKARRTQQFIYDSSNVCMIPAYDNPPFSGEYHRTFQLLSHGCIILYEKSMDHISSDILETCGGIRFTSFDNMLDLGKNISFEIKNTSKINVYTMERIQYMKWWNKQHDDLNNYFLKMFEPFDIVSNKI